MGSSSCGLIDLHGHWYEGSPYGIDTRANLRGGVTTAVDAGTAGVANFGEFAAIRSTRRPCGPRLRARRRGRAGDDGRRRARGPAVRRPRETAAIATEHRDVVIGIRCDWEEHVAERAAAWRCARCCDARRHAAHAPLAEGADIPVALAQPATGRRGHPAFTASGPGILGDDAGASRGTRGAPSRIRFDVGHGCGDLVGDGAQALDEGFGPDAISTDLHRYRSSDRGGPADDDVAIPRLRLSLQR